MTGPDSVQRTDQRVQVLGSMIQPRDMFFHRPRYRDYRWLETNCYSLVIPEAHMGGQIWNGFRTNLDVAASHVMLWSSSDPRAGIRELDYNDQRFHLPMPPGQLTDFKLVNGVSAKMTVPMMEWDVRYEGVNDIVFDLHLRGLCPPLHIAETGTEDVSLGTLGKDHLDQMMSVVGIVRLRGKEYAVDWPAWRDHSWSARPEGPGGFGYAREVASNFDYGAFGNDYAFFVVTSNNWDNPAEGVVHNGYLIDHGTTLRLRHGLGRYHFDERWTIRELTYELEDELNRTHYFTGYPRGFQESAEGTLAVVEWRTRNGDVGWGHYIWHGDEKHIKSHRPPEW